MRFRQMVAGMVLGGAAAISFGAHAALVTMTVTGTASYLDFPAWNLSHGDSSFTLTAVYDDATSTASSASDRAIYINPVQSAKVQFGSAPEIALALGSTRFTLQNNFSSAGSTYFMDSLMMTFLFSLPNTDGLSQFMFYSRMIDLDESSPLLNVVSSVALTSIPQLDFNAFNPSTSSPLVTLRMPEGDSEAWGEMWLSDVSYKFTVAAVDPNAVPEPTSLAVIGLGLAGIAATRRKRSQA